jgi:transketolase
MSTAAGFALADKIPFACTFGVFAAGRAWNQLSISVCYMDLNVNVVGTHGGVSVGPDGATHQALEEITLMRGLPNMQMVIPADAIEAKKATIEAAKIPHPVYLRFTRNAIAVITKESDPFKIGKAIVLKEGSDISLIACGSMVSQALSAAKMLEKELNIKAEVINLHSPKPLDKEAIIKSAEKTNLIVTCEEHTIYGGLGSSVAEVTSEYHPVPIKMMGIKGEFGQSGEAEELMEFYHLTAKGIKLAAEELIKKYK